MSFSFAPLIVLLGVYAYLHASFAFASWVEERTGSGRMMGLTFVATILIPLGILLGFRS